MTVDHWLGVRLRRLGVVTGILRTRSEEEVRVENHGGSLQDLNARIAARASEVDAVVRGYEAKL